MKKNSDKTKLIAPSILSANFAKLGEEIKAVESLGVDWIHVDVMDGHFVPNITVGPVVVEAIRKTTKLPLDVHLMIEKPDDYIDAFLKAGADHLTIHQEAAVHLHRTVHAIRGSGKKAGVSINPATSVETLIEILPMVDLVLVMSVNPGFGGQNFIESSLAKIQKLAILREELKLNFLIEVDGGLNANTVKKVSEAGCDVFVAGSAVFHSSNYATAIDKIRAQL